MQDAGYVYLLINPTMDGLVKIGKTTRDPTGRAKELSSATGVPASFVLVYHIYVRDCSAAESYIHEVLETRNCRVSRNREFFQIATHEAIRILSQAENLFKEGRESRIFYYGELSSSLSIPEDLIRQLLSGVGGGYGGITVYNPRHQK